MRSRGHSVDYVGVLVWDRKAPSDPGQLFYFAGAAAPARTGDLL